MEEWINKNNDRIKIIGAGGGDDGMQYVPAGKQKQDPGNGPFNMIACNN